MYLSFYGLKQKPFQSSTNPSYIWLGKNHKKVLAILQCGILQNQGILVLTGDVGTGKTTLVNALINNLGNEVVVAKVPDPGLELIDFLNYISNAFGMDKRFVCKEDFFIQFERFLQGNAAAGKKVLLIIDEAQRLNFTLLEEIRLLSIIEKQQTKVLNILFVGQNLLSDFLQESQNRAISQRIAISAAISPLSIDETAEYIRQSLRIAGAEKDIFRADAVRNVHEYSGGFLRRINIICGHAMLLGYLQGKKTVTVDMVRQCAEDLCLPDAVEILTPNLLQGVDDSDAENVQDIPPEPLPEIGSRQAWKIIGTVILIVIGVIAATYFNSPQEYRMLFSRILKNGLQVLHISQEIDPVNVRKNAEPLQEKGAVEIHPSSVQINTPSFSEQQTKSGKDISKNIPALTENGPALTPETDARHEGSEALGVSETIETPETIVPVETSVSPGYGEHVESMIEKVTDQMPGVAVGPAEPEEAEEAGEGVEETPASVDPGALIDWVIKKRSE